MSKERNLICQFSGREFVYRGFGRPPKFHPEEAKRARNAAATAKRKAKRDAAALL